MNKLRQLAINEEGFIFDPSTGESFTTNQTGVFILKMLKEGKKEEEILEKITEEFSVDKETAERDLLDFIERLKNYRII